MTPKTNAARLSGTRLRMQQMMRSTLADETTHRTWTYRAVRPMPVPSAWKPGEHVVGDCSKGCQFICKWSDGPDPMRNGWSVYGNSQTIWLVNRHVAFAAELDVGDIITFGRAGSEHAAMVLEAGADPLLWSFGHQGAPNSYRLSMDRRERQFVKLDIRDPPPTPADKLRSHTGWFSWVAWRQAEGGWRGHPKADPHVRPNVPKVIPPRWWADYSRFLAARKHGDKAAG